MEKNFTTEINKEFYKMQLEAFAQGIIDRVDDILEDWDKGIKSIHIEGNVTSSEMITLNITKQYSPKRIELKGETKNV